jgi:hypothetical protein
MYLVTKVSVIQIGLLWRKRYSWLQWRTTSSGLLCQLEYLFYKLKSIIQIDLFHYFYPWFWWYLPLKEGEWHECNTHISNISEEKISTIMSLLSFQWQLQRFFFENMNSAGTSRYCIYSSSRKMRIETCNFVTEYYSE